MATTVEQDTSKWLMIYPIYIDESFSQGKGRRISKEFALTSPTAVEILKAIQSLNLPCALESEKRHSATPRILGRVRFQLKDDSDELWNPDIDNKQTLLLMISTVIAAIRKENALKNPQPTPKGAAVTNATKGKGKK